MALGCAFIFIVILLLWRRRARKQRAKQTAMFASAKRLDGGNGWRWRLGQLRERLFGKKREYHTEVLPMAYHDDPRHDSLAGKSHSRNPVSPNRLEKLRGVENKSSKRRTADSDLDNFIGSYEHSIHSRSGTTASTLPSVDDHYPLHNPRRIERDSLYSQATGNQRFTPEPRQPLRRDAYGASNPVKTDLETQEGKAAPSSSLPLQMVHPSTGSPATEAQTYAMSVRPGLITVSANTTSAQPPAMPSSFIRTTTPIVLTPTPPLMGQAQGQGPYWITPVVNTHPIGGSQQQFHLLDDPSASSLDTVVLQPMNTGGSSRNPFRQGLF